MNTGFSRCLAGSTLGAIITVAFASTAMAQWAPRWGAPFPDEIERGLEAQGYVLTAPLVRRPGVYLADVSAGPAGHQRLIIDARNGQVLERFTAPGRTWGSGFAARDEGFGEPQSGDVGPALNPGPANVRVPAAVSPYGAGETRAGAKVKPQSASTERRASTINPPLPPPAPRETAKLDGSGSAASQPTEKPDSAQPRTNSASTEAGNGPPASAPATQGAPTEASDKPKVSIVPPGLFE